MRPKTLAITALISAFALLFSCGPKRILTEQTKDYRSLFQGLQVAHTIDRNGAVNDRTEFYIAPVQTSKPDCDSVCDAYVRNMMKSLNSRKSSGKNGYSMTWDDYNRLLKLNMDLAETVNQKKDSVVTIIEKQVEIRNKEIPVEYTPEWMLVLAGIGGATVIYLLWRVYRWIVRKINPASAIL